jgi:hypothetical protein
MNLSFPITHCPRCQSDLQPYPDSMLKNSDWLQCIGCVDDFDIYINNETKDLQIRYNNYWFLLEEQEIENVSTGSCYKTNFDLSICFYSSRQLNDLIKAVLIFS